MTIGGDGMTGVGEKILRCAQNDREVETQNDNRGDGMTGDGRKDSSLRSE